MLTRVLRPWKKKRSRERPVLPPNDQIRAWRKAARKGGWQLSKATVPAPPGMHHFFSEEDDNDSWLGPFLFHGFGDDGAGNSDQVLSGQLAWRLLKKRHHKVWRCEYADFNRPNDICLRPGAPARPKGFYWAFLNPGWGNQKTTINNYRKKLTPGETGLAAEGLQLLAVTRPHLVEMMEDDRFPFMALADYDVAPHGFDDFFESPQLFKSQGTVGLGVGNVDGVYPRFAIPSLHLAGGGEAGE